MKAYIDTTILADRLLKPNSDQGQQAKIGLKRFDETLLPVYAIKEFKAGILSNYGYFHDKLLQMGSLSKALEAIGRLYFRRYKMGSALSALTAAVTIVSSESDRVIFDGDMDKELADRYRLALASLIMRAWRNRRRVTSQTIQDLDCYTETAPKIARTGFIDFKPQLCEERECSLASELKKRPDLLEILRDAIPANSARSEDRNRRAVLKKLIKNSAHYRLDREDCKKLGDAVFAFFCPSDCVILTTNIRDHKPLANAINKDAVIP